MYPIIAAIRQLVYQFALSIVTFCELPLFVFYSTDFDNLPPNLDNDALSGSTIVFVCLLTSKLFIWSCTYLQALIFVSPNATVCVATVALHLSTYPVLHRFILAMLLGVPFAIIANLLVHGLPHR